MSRLMSPARLRWSRAVVGCQSNALASCHNRSRSATVAPTVPGAVPRSPASHSAISARTAFFDPRKVLAT